MATSIDVPETADIPTCHKQNIVLRATKAAVPTTDRLSSLARSLGRPVSHDWLSLAAADAALLLATDREPDAGDVVDTWQDLRGVLRQELAST
jgi:hypothetical protein